MLTRYRSPTSLFALFFLLAAVTDVRAQVITDFYRTGTGVPGTDWRFGEPGDTISIVGTGFTGVTAVRFGGFNASTFFVVADTQINATVPLSAASGLISVVKGGNSFFSSLSFEVIGPEPYIVSLSANVGAPLSTITVEGDNFVNSSGQPIITGMTFNGTPAASAPNGQTARTVSIPIGGTTGPITATSPAGTRDSRTNFFYYAPVITNLAPIVGAPGTVVTVRGSNFIGATSVIFANGLNVVPTVASNSMLTATVPFGARTGRIFVVAPAGSKDSTNEFLVPPTLAGFTPSNGVIGQVVNIRGTNLYNASSVTFNGVPALNLVTNTAGTNVTATVAVGTRTGFVLVTTPSGSVTSSVPFYLPPEFTDPPFTPEFGLAGTEVTLSGVNFSNATAVTFNGVPAAFSNLSPTSIRAVLPGSALSGPVAVTTPGGMANSSPDIFQVRPLITGFTPTAGLPGVEVTITGTNFTDTPVVTFNFTNATVTMTSLTTLKALVPTNATTGTIRVGTLGGVADSGAIFTVLVPDIELSIGRTNGGVLVSWPTDPVGFRLQATPTLTPPILWGAAGGSTSVLGGRMNVLNPSTGSNGFFRLIRP